MSKIRITDQLNVELISTDAGPGSGLSKYFKGGLAGFVASSELVQALNKPVSSLGSSPLGFGMTFHHAGAFGSSGVDWTLQAGARSLVHANQAGSNIVGDEVFGDPIAVPADKTFLSYTLSPTIVAGAGGAVGDLRFGFKIGSALLFRSGRFFELGGGAGPSLREALTQVLSKTSLPGDVADLEAMSAGDVASVSGSGEFQVSASFDLAAAMNPLAAPTLGLNAIGAIQVKAGASITVGAKVGISGSYQIRVVKLDGNRISLGYYRMAGSEFQFEVNASAGVSASLGQREFLVRLLSGLSTATKADIVNLVDAGMSDQQIGEIQAAITASIQRSLSLSLIAGFTASAKDEAVFEYEFDLSLLDVVGREALHLALDGDLAPLTAVGSGALPSGVRLIRSQLETLKKKSFTWKINLLGIVNVLHLTELVRTGKVLFEPASGELVITDSITYKEIFVKTRPFEADTQKLRKLLMQSMVVTAAYRASGMRNFLGFSCSLTYFDQTANARKQSISDYLDHFLALGLIDGNGKTDFLTAPAAGRASLLLDLSLNDAGFQAMFKNPDGLSRSQEDYDVIGRKCVLQLVQAGDENDFRRIPMLDNGLWKHMTELGQFGMRTVMPQALSGTVAFALVVHDYTVIRWWSAAMKTAAERVAGMLAFLKGADAETLKDNNDFKKKRNDLSVSLVALVKNSQPDFLDAWGLIAMDAAARQSAVVRATLLTQEAFLVKGRP